MSRVPLLAAVLALVAACGAAPAAADTLLSVEPSAPKISAAGDAAAWSTYDTTAGTWFLVIRQGGVLERAAVAPRSVPFDVDLGRDAGGRLVAAYSRCDREPQVFAPTGRGCDLYAYDLASRRERKLGGPSSATASEYMPSLAAGRVAFGRVHERREGAAGVRTEIYVRPLHGGSARRLPGGTRNADDRTGLTGLDLDAHRLAVAWHTAGPAGVGIPYGTAELRVDSLSGETQTLVVRLLGTSLDYGSIVTPGLVGRRVRYGIVWVNEGGTTIGDVQTYDLARATRASLRLPDRLAGVAVTGRDTYFVRCNPEWMPPPQRCDVSVRETAAGRDPDYELAHAERPTPVSWYRDWVAFSAYDGSLPGYRLMLRSSEGRVLRPDVPARSVPFDVDLGHGPDAQLTAVYSRCRVEPRRDPIDGLPLHATGRDCDVYRYDTHSRRETKVCAAARRGASEFLPAIDGSRIAFARRAGRGATSLYAADVAGAPLTQLAGGPRGADDRLGPRAINLRGRRLAVAWDHRLSDGRLRSQVRLDVLEGRNRVLASITSRDGARRYREVGFNGNVLSWVGYGLPGLARTVAIRQQLGSGERRVFVLPDSATVYVPWTTYVGVPRPHEGAYGRADAGGWSLRTPLMLPELLR